MTPEDRNEGRCLATLKVLWELLGAAKQKVDPLTWRREGGPEAEDFLDALERGGPHPLLERWQDVRRTGAANRAAPGLLDQNTRRFSVLMVEALLRGGLSKDAARRRAAEAVKSLLPSTSKRTIKYWQSNYAVTEEDEQILAQAIERHGPDPERLFNHFAGLIRWADNPHAAWTARRLSKDGQQAPPSIVQKPVPPSP